VACVPHYYGLPSTSLEAIRQFTSLWGEAGPLGCARLCCLSGTRARHLDERRPRPQAVRIAVRPLPWLDYG
jgi:hypothetical protein